MEYHRHDGYHSQIVEDVDMVSVQTRHSGIFKSLVKAGDEVVKGQVLAKVIDSYEGEVIDTLLAPVDGIIFFIHAAPLTYADTSVFKMIPQQYRM